MCLNQGMKKEIKNEVRNNVADNVADNVLVYWCIVAYNGIAI